MKIVNELIPIVLVIVLIWLVLFLPLILSKIIDPKNIRIIQTECKSQGFSNVKINIHPNHYGVSYIKDGKKQYAKCKVVGGVIKWLNKKS